MGPVPFLAYIARLFGLRVLGYLSCAVMASCVCQVSKGCGLSRPSSKFILDSLGSKPSLPPGMRAFLFVVPLK